MLLAVWATATLSQRDTWVFRSQPFSCGGTQSCFNCTVSEAEALCLSRQVLTWKAT